MVVPIRNSLAFEPQGASDEQKAALVARILRGELTPREVCEQHGLSEPELRHWVRAYARAARRAVDDQVASALAAHGLDVDELAAAEFSGNLEEMSVAELIQTIQFGRKDAQIRVDHAGEQSHLWCIEGDVVDALSSRLSGAAAVYRILSLTQGRLHADFSPVQRARTIHASTQALMLEAAKRSDECAQIRARLGDTWNVYVASASAPSESEIEPDQADVLRAFDGTRSVEQVVHDSEFPDLETLGMIELLLERQWLVLEPFRARPAPPSTTTSLVSMSTAGSFMPFAASAIGTRPSRLGPRQRLWLSAVAGVAVVAAAFSVGFYSAPGREVSRVVVATPAAPPITPSCGPNAALLPGGSCLDRSEVTAGQYQACVHAGVCEPAQRELDTSSPTGAATIGGVVAPAAIANAPAPALAPGSNPPSAEALPPGEAGEATARCNAGLSGRENFAVNCVTAQQARRYCEWRGGRLPSRSEWEFAATSGGSVPARGLIDGVAEWTLEQSARPEPEARERYFVVGGAGASTARPYLNANAQGRSVGFRCVTALGAPTSGRGG